MNKSRVYLSAIARFLILAGILFFYTAFLYSEAKSCPISNEMSVKPTSVFKYKNSDSLTEEFSFLIQDFKMNHQSDINILNIKVRYCYETAISNSKYPDFRLIAKDVQDFLENYPNKTDYWEIVNKQMTLTMLKKYPMLSSIKSEIQVSPSQSVPYLRSSIVTRHQSKSAGVGNNKKER